MRSLFSKFFNRLIPRFAVSDQAKKLLSQLANLIARSLPTLFAYIAIVIMVNIGLFQPIEFLAYNRFTTWRGVLNWDERVVIVAIDEKSINKLGRFPWSRDIYVPLLRKLSQDGASVVGFDLLWSESSPQDNQLTEAIEQYQRVVLAMAWDKSGQALFPTAKLSNASVAVGHILKREDVDGIVRQFDLAINDVPSFGVAVLQSYKLISESIPPMPDLNQPLFINWIKSVKDIPQFSLSDVIAGVSPASAFRDKIVLVGVTAAGIDSLPTPFDRNPPASGVHLHAMVIQNLLQMNALTVVQNTDIWSFALLGSLFISLILPRRNLWLGSISAFVLSGLWLAIAFIAFYFNYWLAISVPIFMFLLTGFAIAIQERFQMQRSLSIADAKIRYDSTHDRLTGLFNRAFTEEILDDLLNRYQSSPKEFSTQNVKRKYLFAILWINIDRFKSINDTFGHPIGNLLLIEVGKDLQGSTPRKSSIARFGGSEFVILLEDLEDEQAAIDITKRIQQTLQKTFVIQGNEINICANIGIRFHQIDNIDNHDTDEVISPDILLRDADTAMFYAKKLDNVYYKVFELSMRELVLERIQLEKDLRKAVALTLETNKQISQEFLVYYQPILSLQDMQIVGLEALIRWQQPERGLVSPTYFIPLAEETGLIIPIGDWIMRTACLQLKSWHQQFPLAKNITVSVNLSTKQLAQDDVLEKCLTILKETNLSPKHLKLELTESSVMENPNFAISILKKIQKAGIHIYIDDFGTGYSSLAYLHKFPFNGLKIDRSFVNNIRPNTNGMDILQAIVALAQSVNAHIVAEGIESLDQLNYLQDLLIKEGDGQGFFLFQPLNIAAIESLFQTL